MAPHCLFLQGRLVQTRKSGYFPSSSVKPCPVDGRVSLFPDASRSQGPRCRELGPACQVVLARWPQRAAPGAEPRVGQRCRCLLKVWELRTKQLVSVSVSALLLQRDTVTKETYVSNWGVLIVSEGLLSSWWTCWEHSSIHGFRAVAESYVLICRQQTETLGMIMAFLKPPLV